MSTLAILGYGWIWPILMIQPQRPGVLIFPRKHLDNVNVFDSEKNGLLAIGK